MSGADQTNEPENDQTSDHDSLIIHAHYSVYIFVIVTLACFAASYAVSVPANLLERDYFVVSAAFGLDPARAIAAFLLPIASAMMWSILISKSLSMRSYPEVKRSKLRRMWFAILGGVSAVAMIGVSAVSVMSDAKGVHSFCAFLMFSCMLTASLIITIEDYYVKGWSRLLVMHVVCLVCAVLGLVMMIIGFCVQYYTGIWQFGTVSSSSEIVMILAEIAYVSTFAIELSSYKIIVRLGT